MTPNLGYRFNRTQPQTLTYDHTLPKVSDLTDERLNLIIAEECGWKRVWNFNKRFALFRLKVEDGDEPAPKDAELHTSEVISPPYPRYTESLDAMHEAVERLSELECEEYINDLAPKGKESWWRLFEAVETTAKQRAMAFVIAKGRAVL